MNKIHYLGLSLLAFLPLSEAFATVCVNENGVPTEVYYDLTDKFNSSNNQVGQIVTLSEKSQWVGVNAVCPKGTSGNTTKRSYVTEFPVTGTSDGYQYLKLNDYLDGAMKITDSYAGTFYPPRKYIQMGSHPNVSKNKPFGVQDSSLVFRLKVTLYQYGGDPPGNHVPGLRHHDLHGSAHHAGLYHQLQRDHSGASEL